MTLRIISPTVPRLNDADTDYALLVSCKYETSSADQVTRVYPYGGGIGDGKLTLAEATKGAADYAGLLAVAVDTSAGYVRLDPEGTRVDRSVGFKDIQPETPDERERERAANALLDAAVVWLYRHSQAVTTYSIVAANIAPGAVNPGDTVHVEYGEYVGGTEVLSIDDDLIVLEVQREIGGGPAGLTRLMVSTIAAWPVTDAELLAREIRNVRAIGSRPQAVGFSNVQTQDFVTRAQSLVTGNGGLAYGGADAASAVGGSIGLAAHELVGTYHYDSGMTAGQVIRAESTASFTWAAIADADLPATIARTNVVLTAGDGLTGGGDLSTARTFAVGAGNGVTVAADSVAVTQGAGLTVSSTGVALTTPGTLTVATTNVSSGSHTHAVTASANPGAAAALLKTSSSGTLQLEGLGVGIAASTGAVMLTTGGKVEADYTAGWTGSGFSLQKTAGGSLLELDDLSVRGTMNVYELLIHQIRATNGSIFVANTGKTKTVTGSGSTWAIETEGYHGFSSGDLITAQRFTGIASSSGLTGEAFRSDLTVQTATDATHYTATISTARGTTTPPAAGYDYVRIGHTSDPDRQGSIYLTADDTYAPYINVLTGVSTHSEWGGSAKTKVHIGNMNSYYGVTGNTYGFGVGEYAATTGNWLRYSSGGGLKLQAGAGALSLDNVGLTFIGATGGVYAVASAINWQTTDHGLAYIAAYESADGQTAYLQQGFTATTENVQFEVQAIGQSGYTGNATLIAGTVGGTYNQFSLYSSGTITTTGATNWQVPSGFSLGLSTSAGRLQFNDATTDSVSLLNGNLGIHTTDPGYAIHAVESTSICDIGLNSYSTDSSLRRSFLYMTVTNGDQTTPSAVTANDAAGEIIGGAYTGSQMSNAWAIKGVVEATPDTTGMPMSIVFMATSSGEVTRTEKMRLSGSGSLGVGTTEMSLAKGDISAGRYINSFGGRYYLSTAGNSYIYRTSTGGLHFMSSAGTDRTIAEA